MPMTPSGTMRALIVHNEAITREFLAHLLRMGGYDVLSDDTGERALITMRRWRGRIDLLLTDVKLPGLVDGWMVGDAFRLCNPLRPILYASETEVDLEQSEANAAFVRTPASPLELLERIKGVSTKAPKATMPDPSLVLLAS